LKNWKNNLCNPFTFQPASSLWPALPFLGTGPLRSAFRPDQAHQCIVSHLRLPTALPPPCHAPAPPSSAHGGEPPHSSISHHQVGPPGAFLLPQGAQATAAHPATPPHRMPPIAAIPHSDGAEPKHRPAAFTLPH
jgi:hypothetical protein